MKREYGVVSQLSHEAFVRGINLAAAQGYVVMPETFRTEQCNVLSGASPSGVEIQLAWIVMMVRESAQVDNEGESAQC